MEKEKKIKMMYCEEHEEYFDAKVHAKGCPLCFKESKPSIITAILKVLIGAFALSGFIIFMEEIMQAKVSAFLSGILAVTIIIYAIMPFIEFAYNQMTDKDKKTFPTVLLSISCLILFLALMIISIETEEEIDRLKAINNMIMNERITQEGQTGAIITPEGTKPTFETQQVMIDNTKLLMCEEKCLNEWEYNHGKTAIGVNGEWKHECFTNCFNQIKKPITT